ncbi:hypothetical protein HN873_029813, partial [Arachis hypogaea]
MEPRAIPSRHRIKRRSGHYRCREVALPPSHPRCQLRRILPLNPSLPPPLEPRTGEGEEDASHGRGGGGTVCGGCRPVTTVYLCHCQTAALRCLAGAFVTIAGDLWLPENTAVVAAEGGGSLATVRAARSSPMATETITEDATTWLSHFFLVA